ncbi:hypothetical protein COO60DRAFT_537691 [Scenedesmus sp. NREL 46B-D3]|nr:hypothetical protein COO60DRAFT_537691 [Scenedesmus sp. NREL 46B-D3]
MEPHSRKVCAACFELLHDQYNQQQQGQKEQGSCPAHVQQQQQQQQQQHPLAQLLLACAPDVAALPHCYKDRPSFDSNIPGAAWVSDIWGRVVAAAPAAVEEAVEEGLLEQLFSAASGCGLSEHDSSSSSSSSSSSFICTGREAVSVEGGQLKEPCWGCCSIATSRISNRPSSTSSVAHRAATSLQALQGVVPAGNLLRPHWRRLIDPQPRPLTLPSDAPAAAALVKLQQSLLLQLAAHSRASPSSAHELVQAALQQQLQAALAGDRDAQALVGRFAAKPDVEPHLLHQAPALVAVLQAEPWLQQQQQPQGQACVFACSTLCKLTTLDKQQAAVVEACRSLPAYLQELLLGPAATSSSIGAHAAAAATAAATAGASAGAPEAAAAAFLGWCCWSALLVYVLQSDLCWSMWQLQLQCYCLQRCGKSRVLWISNPCLLALWCTAPVAATFSHW